MKSNITAKIIVAVLPMLHVMELNKTADSRYEITGGGEGQSAKDILDALGMEYELVVPHDNIYGRRKSNGSWTGIIGMVSRGEADLAISGLGISNERLQVVDFAKPLIIGYLTFAVGRAGKFRPKNAYLYPFHLPVWACFFALFFVMAAAMWLVFEKKYSIGRIVFELYAVTLRQPFTLDAWKWKSKFFVAAIFLYGFVITSGYSGVLLSFMTVTTQGKTVGTFEELSDAVVKGTHRCYVVSGTPIIPYLVSNKEKYLQLLGKEIFKNKWYVDADSKSLMNMMSPNDAVISHNLVFEIVFGGVNAQKLKRYLVSEDSLAMSIYGIAMNRNFCCKKKLNTIISRIWESGMYLKYLRDTAPNIWYDNVPVEEEKEHKISIEDISVALIALCAGYAISFLTLFTEIMYFKYA